MARLTVNGAVRDFQAEDDTPLLWVLREQLGLTGTNRHETQSPLPVKSPLER